MKGWTRWALLIGGGLVAAALIGAGVLAYLVSRVDVRAEIERAVEGATGRDLVIEGGVGVSFWPVLGIRANDISLANVEGGRAPSLMTADRINIGVELGPLMNRQVVVRRLVLARPQIALEVNGEGEPNWILTPRPVEGPPRPPSEPAVDLARTSLREVRINDGEISFYDARQGAGWVIGDADLSTALTRLDRPMQIDGSIRYKDRPVQIDAQIARPGAALRGETTALRLDLESELLNAAFDGQTLATSGELAGTVRASGPSLRELVAWTGSPLEGAVGLAHFDVSGRIEIARGVYSFSNAGFVIDLVRGRGDFVLSEVRGRPYVSGRLQLFDFDLNPYLTGQAPPTDVDPSPGQAAPAPSAEIAAVEAGPRAVDVQEAPSERPIDFSGLQAFNADLELVTAAVLVQHMRVDSARLNLVLHDGYLAATLHNMGLYGGSGRGRIEIDARGPAVRISPDLAFDGLDARRFLSDAINFSNIEGRAELTLDVDAVGRTQSEMIASADGRTHIEVVSGVLHGVDLGGVATTIRNALRGELIAPEARTQFHGFSGSFAIADGVLASENLSFNTPDLRIPGIAVIDMQQRRLDARLAPRSPRGGVVIPFSIRGPWGQFSYAGDLNDRAQQEVLARVREVQAAARR